MCTFNCQELSEIEVFILNIPLKIKKYQKSLKKKLLKTQRTPLYRKKIKEMREYLEMLDKNSACGEIKEEK